MTNQTVYLITRIFSYTFFGYQALFVFDNTANYIYFVKNTLLAKKINLGAGKKQPQMRNRSNNVI